MGQDKAAIVARVRPSQVKVGDTVVWLDMECPVIARRHGRHRQGIGYAMSFRLVTPHGTRWCHWRADERVTIALERAKADPEGSADAKQLTTAPNDSGSKGQP